MTFLVKRYNNLSVFYTPVLDGGGTGFGQDYVPAVDHLIGKVDRAFEFCSGPGFIGFSLLAHGLCRSLCLSDINPAAVAAARHTVQHNGLQDVVAVYESDALDQIPRAEKWDLVVSNPPHFSDQYNGSIRHHDPDWSIHRRFYAGLKPHLKPGGVALIQENFEGSNEGDFCGMIASGGLANGSSFMWADRNRKGYLDSYYFVTSRRTEDEPRRYFKDNLIDCSEPAVMKDVLLSNDGIAEIRLDPFKRYRFRFVSRLEEDVSLLVFKLKFGVVPRFLRTFGTVTVGSGKPSYSFHFFPGCYVLKDEKSRRTLARVMVG